MPPAVISIATGAAWSFASGNESRNESDSNAIEPGWPANDVREQ